MSRALFSTNSSGPAFNVSADYGIFKELSIGGGITYQSCSVTVPGWYNQYTYKNENVIENISRVNFRLRITAHWDFSDDHLWEMYGGAAVGESVWNDANNAHDPNFPCDAPWNMNVGTSKLVSFQGYLGLRGYFTENLGAHLELAVGSPYFVETGISFRFGGIPLNLRGDN